MDNMVSYNVLGEDFKLYLPEEDITIQQFIKSQRSYESHIFRLLNWICKPDHVVVDVGANLGQHTITLARRVKKVYAIEPIKDICNYLKRNLEINQVDQSKVEILQLATWNEKTEILIDYMPTHVGVAHISNKGISTKTETLDNLFADKNIDLFKIDVEGAELQTLKGMTKCLEKFPNIIMEVNKKTSIRFGGYDPQDLIDFFHPDYRMYWNLYNKWVEASRHQLKNFLEKIPLKTLIDIYITKNRII